MHDYFHIQQRCPGTTLFPQPHYSEVIFSSCFISPMMFTFNPTSVLTSLLAFSVGCRSNFHSLSLFKLFRKMMKKPKIAKEGQLTARGSATTTPALLLLLLQSTTGQSRGSILLKLECPQAKKWPESLLPEGVQESACGTLATLRYHLQKDSAKYFCGHHIFTSAQFLEEQCLQRPYKYRLKALNLREHFSSYGKQEGQTQRSLTSLSAQNIHLFILLTNYAFMLLLSVPVESKHLICCIKQT